MANRAKKLEGKYERSFRLNRDAINEDERTVQLSFSSEEPYERYFGTEVASVTGDNRIEFGASILDY